MRNTADEAAAEVLEDGFEIFVGVALMQEDRLGDGHGQFQLRDEGGSLRRGRREVTEIIQAAFADGNHLGLSQ